MALQRRKKGKIAANYLERRTIVQKFMHDRGINKMRQGHDQGVVIGVQASTQRAAVIV